MEKKVLVDHKDKTLLMEMHDTVKMIRDHMKKCGERAGLNTTFFRIIRCIDCFGSVSQVDLVNYTHLKAPTISLTLKNMEYEGIIKKEVDPNDARGVKISFTDKGRELCLKNMDLIRCEELEIEKVITEEERKVLYRVLNKIQEEIGKRDENI